MAVVQARKPKFRRTGIESFSLTERDVDFVRAIARHRFSRSTHLDLLFPEASHDNLRRRLDALFQAGYIERPRAQRERYCAGAGDKPFTYSIGNKGAALLAEEPGFRRSAVDWTRKAREVTHAEIEHALEITDFMVALEAACREHRTLRVIYLDEILATVAPAETRENPKPYFWPVRVRWRGREHVIHPIPDKIFGLHDSARPEGRNRRFFFLEADRGTMPVVRADDLSRTSYLRKLLAYGYSYRSKLHANLYGFTNVRVLTVTTGPARIANIAAAYRQYAAQVCASGVFLFADRSTLAKAENFFDPLWTDGAGQKHSLIE